MPKLLFLLWLLSCCSASCLWAQSRVIYAEDSRRFLNLAELKNTPSLQAYKSVAAKIPRAQMLGIKNYHFTFRGDYMAYTLEAPVCLEEPFRHNLALATCSGVLIAPQILLTAGHCVASYDQCKEAYWVFDFVQELTLRKRATLHRDQVYRCQKILLYKNQDKFIDFAVIKLDRPVVNRVPLSLRKKTIMPSQNSQSGLGLACHSQRLPLMIDQGGKILAATKDYYLTNHDAFEGCSGGPLIAGDHTVLGILVEGSQDWVYDQEKNCMRSVRCHNALPSNALALWLGSRSTQARYCQGEVFLSSERIHLELKQLLRRKF